MSNASVNDQWTFSNIGDVQMRDKNPPKCRTLQ